ncbi:MAG: Ldh family oxidoreductase [Anaerolineales bacterium]
MPTFHASQLDSLLRETLIAAGTPRDIAGYVAGNLVDASLKGVDSHGVMRVTKYINEIKSGWIKPEARPEIQTETVSMALVQGNKGFGIYALGYALDLAIQKARANQVSAIGLVDTTHTGRLGRFGEIAAENNMMVLIAGGGHSGTVTSGRWVAPFGGAERLLSTNPYVVALPGGRYGPVVIDFATSAVGEGKLQIYRAKHQELSPGWIQDKAGSPSVNVEDFYAGGALLPVAGHKGYGLAVIAELLGAAMLGVAHTMNWIVLALDVTAFVRIEEYDQVAEAFLQKIKESTPAPGFDEVSFPGEPEIRTAEIRSREGISIPKQTWEEMQKTARSVGVDPEVLVKNHKKVTM